MKNGLYIFSVIIICISCKRDKPSPPIQINDPKPPAAPSITLMWDNGTNSGFTETAGQLNNMGKSSLFLNAIANPGNKINRIRVYWQESPIKETTLLDSVLTPAPEAFSKTFAPIDFSRYNYTGTPNIILKAVAWQDDGQADTTTLSILKPTVSFYWHDGTGYTNKDGIIPFGQPLSFKISANASNGQSLSTVAILLTIDGYPQQAAWDTSFFSPKPQTFDKEFKNLSVPKYAGATLVFTFYSAESQSSSPGKSSFTIKVGNPPIAPTVKTDNAIVLEAQQNPGTRSFFHPQDGAAGVMTKTQVIPANTEMLYFYDAVGPTLAVPAAQYAKNALSFITQWNVLNDGYFLQTTLTAANFDNIGANSYETLKKECSKTTSFQFMRNPKAGDVIAWVDRKRSYYVLIKVTAVSPGTTGSITFDMKRPVF